MFKHVDIAFHLLNFAFFYDPLLAQNTLAPSIILMFDFSDDLLNSGDFLHSLSDPLLKLFLAMVMKQLRSVLEGLDFSLT